MNFKRKIGAVLSILLVSILSIIFVLTNREEKLYKNIDVGVSSNNILTVVKELSSEKYDGRLIGTKGNELATDYIEKHFRKIGLKKPEKLNSYRQNYKQNVRMTNQAPILGTLDKNGKLENEITYIKDFSVITYNSLIRISGKAKGNGVILRESRDLTKNPQRYEGNILLVPEKITKGVGISSIILQIIENNIKVDGILVEVKAKEGENSAFPVAPNASKVDTFSKNGPMMFVVRSKEFDKLCDLSREGKKIYMTADYSIESVEGANLIGIIEGQDERLKNEFIIIGAHFDHAGNNKNGTYNPGALDNASGTATMMEIARVLAQNSIKPKKSILFIGFNGEEEGLYGSYHYVDNPLYPLDDKTMMINLDMVGSKRVVPLKSISFDSKNTGLRDELYDIAKELGIEVKTDVNQGSDHVPFATKGIQSACLIHMDMESGYHTPIDTPDKVDKKRVAEVAKVVLSYLDKNAY